MDGRKFLTLDALRGIAALAVVMFHLSGPFAAVRHGYLAVDLFFLMSGFVVAAAYEERLLDGWGVGAFMAVRLKRLWPVYAVGVVLGAASFAAIRLLRPDLSFVMPHAAPAQVFAMGLLLLPQFVFYGGPAFPFNSASWSLSVELFGNLAYGALARTLRTPMLLAFAATGLAGLAIIALRVGDLDVGVTAGGVAAGYIRFLFSFSAGVLLHRWHAAGRLPALALPWWLPLLAAAITFGMPGLSSGWYDLAVVALVYPAILVASLHNRVPARAAAIFGWAGAVSYPLYVVHPPLVDAAKALAAAGSYPATAVVLLVAAVALAHGMNRWFDRPLQAWLRRPRRTAWRT